MTLLPGEVSGQGAENEQTGDDGQLERGIAGQGNVHAVLEIVEQVDQAKEHPCACPEQREQQTPITHQPQPGGAGQ